jgi:hypothetical protein
MLPKVVFYKTTFIKFKISNNFKKTLMKQILNNPRIQRKFIPAYGAHPQNVQLHNVQLQNVQLPNVQLQNIQDTKRPGYKTSSYQTSSYRTSMIQNVQDTKRPVLVNLKTCLKNRGQRQGILDAVHALRPARRDVVVKLGVRRAPSLIQLRGCDTHA